MRTPDRLADEQIDTYIALMDVAGQLRFRLEHHLRDQSRLSYVQFEILGRLMRATDNQLRMTDLADSIALSRSGLTYQVSSLYEAGFVKRWVSLEDERTTLVQLTDSGRAEFVRLLPGHIAIVRSLLFDALLDKESRSLGRLFRRIRSHVRTLPPRSVQTRRRASPSR